MTVHWALTEKSSVRFNLLLATIMILSLSKFKLTFSLAEIGTQMQSPSSCSGTTSCDYRSSMVFSTSASYRSILLMATMRGICISLAKLITSIVCCYTLSTAEITRIIMSVTLAPLDLMLQKASWPGVSIKVISVGQSSSVSPEGTVNAPIDWVIAPYSLAHLSWLVLKASSSVVLPWSTCPMIVMIGALLWYLPPSNS